MTDETIVDDPERVGAQRLDPRRPPLGSGLEFEKRSVTTISALTPKFVDAA